MNQISGKSVIYTLSLMLDSNLSVIYYPQWEKDQNSKAEIIELQISKGDLKKFTNSIIQIELLENSQIDFLKIQERSVIN